MMTVLRISAVGGTLLFFALAGLVALMYLLTAPWLFRGKVEGAEPASAPSEDDEEHERRRRAAALVVAAACAEEGQMRFFPVDIPADWRLLHRARLLGGAPIRRRTRQ